MRWVEHLPLVRLPGITTQLGLVAATAWNQGFKIRTLHGHWLAHIVEAAR